MKEFSFKQFIYIILILIFIYVGFETLLRWTLPKLFGFVIELNELANIKNVENYSEYYFSNSKKYLNPIIGFNRDYTDIEFKKNNKKKLIVIGASVTGGSGTKKNFSSFLSDKLKNTFQIYNFSTENHGIYQISYNMKKSSDLIQGDLYLITTVAHALLRPGKNYMSSFLRPIYFIDKENKLIINKNYNYERFIRGYINSKKYFYNGLWISKFLFDNRKYYLASFYTDFYEKIYTESLLNIINSTTNNSKTIIALLPSNFEFRYRNFVIKTFKKAIYKFSQKKNIIFIEIDQCVMDFFKLNEINYFNYTSLLHPGEIAHEAYSQCIFDELKKRKLI